MIDDATKQQQQQAKEAAALAEWSSSADAKTARDLVAANKAAGKNAFEAMQKNGGLASRGHAEPARRSRTVPIRLSEEVQSALDAAIDLLKSTRDVPRTQVDILENFRKNPPTMTVFF